MNILLIEFNDNYFRDIAASIVRNKASVSHIVTSFPELYEESVFNDVQIIDEKQFHYLNEIEKINKFNLNALSKKEIETNYDIESMFLSITDRICFYPKTIIDRKYVYYELLLYWITFLNEKKINTIIFPRVPHLGYGNIIYYLAKKMGIRVTVIRETLLDDTVLISDGYNNFKKIPASFLNGVSIQDLEKELGNNWLVQIYQTSNLMSVNTNDNETVIRKNSGNIFQSFLNLNTFKAILSLIHNPFSRFYGSPTFLEKPTTWFQYYIMILRYYFKNKKILKYYKENSKTPSLINKYIYLPLHYQPERTSMPEGDIFHDQILMIDILSKSIPKNWKIYVKEHPNQFSRMDIRKMNFRNIEFYKQIGQYKNVELISLSFDSQKLIDNSKIVVTLTGSTGWEALIKSKPVITFCSSAWYSPCNSCFVVTSVDECKKAISKINKLTKNKVRTDLLKYLLFYKNQFVNSAYDIQLTKSSSIPYEKLVTNMSQALIRIQKNK